MVTTVDRYRPVLHAHICPQYARSMPAAPLTKVCLDLRTRLGVDAEMRSLTSKTVDPTRVRAWDMNRDNPAL
jgi:hypothetical protein